jgi:hypothetical protein
MRFVAVGRQGAPRHRVFADVRTPKIGTIKVLSSPVASDGSPVGTGFLSGPAITTPLNFKSIPSLNLSCRTAGAVDTSLFSAGDSDIRRAWANA